MGCLGSWSCGRGRWAGRGGSGSTAGRARGPSPTEEDAAAILRARGSPLGSQQDQICIFRGLLWAGWGAV